MGFHITLDSQMKLKQTDEQIAELQRQAAGLNDYQLNALLDGLGRSDLARFFYDTEALFIDSECGGLADKARRAMRLSDYWRALNILRTHHDSFGYGQIYSNNDSTLYAIAHLNVNGCPRITTFNLTGFLGHSDLRPTDKVENELYSIGMRRPFEDQNILDEIFTRLSTAPVISGMDST